MASTVTAVAGATVAAPIVTPSRIGTYARDGGRAETGNSSSLDKDAFLKLLVAQLKYQDPMKPSSSEEFIATTAQFTVVEKLDELTKQGAATALVSSLATASSLVGRTISALQDGTPVQATVLRTMIASGEVVLDTDKGAIRLDDVTSIGPSALVAATPTSTPPTESSPAASPPAEPTTQTQENP